MSRFDSLDPCALVAVHGGQEVTVSPSTDGLNTDVTSRRMGVYLLGGRIPIPYRYDTTRQARTNFGHCVDQSGQRCESTSTENAVVGACKLDGIEQCWQQRGQQP
jgi:hypothetical protein